MVDVDPDRGRAYEARKPGEMLNAGNRQQSLGSVVAAQAESERDRVVGSSWWARVLRVTVLVTTDLVSLSACALAAYWIWARSLLGQKPSVYLPLLPLVLLFPLAYGTAGLYPGFGVGAVQTLRRLTLRTSLIMLVLMAFSFTLKVPPRYSRVTVALLWIGALLAVPLARYLVLGLAQRWSSWREPAVLVGMGRRVDRLREALDAAVSLGYRPLAFLAPDKDSPGDQSLGGTFSRGRQGLESAPWYASRGVRVAFVVDEVPSSEWPLLDLLQQHFRHVVVVHPLASLPVEGVIVRDLGGVLGLEFTNQLLMLRNKLTKRVLDLVLGAFALVCFLPIIALSAVAVKLCDSGPAFFSQEREGLNGGTIRVWKLRTMFVDARERLDRHLAQSAKARAEWQRSVKLARDPRVIPGVGRFFRRFSVDELPQLWNVVRGEMSLVGPRPFPPYHLRKFSRRFLELRRRVRPGITGLWQVMIRSAGSIEEQEAFDTHYIRNWSIWMDVYIFAKTVTAVLSGRGAH